jgi:predicted dehydrogenase/flavin reductase (DIM6/NTAB) family NADH-FMN oxidoreductase RutF
MIWPGRTIWDTRAQSVCGIISAKGDLEPELFGSASFAQFSLSPPRVIINPNRTYPIESAIQNAGRFAINVLPASKQDLMIRVMRVRRRQPGKAKVLGVQLSQDAHGIPFLSEALRVVFCEVERTVETGDRRLYVARVVESRLNPKITHDLPLLFPEVSDRDSLAFGLPKVARKVLLKSGLWDLLKKSRTRLKPLPPPNIALTTYEEAGATEAELTTILKHGALDSSRYLALPSAPAFLRKELGICVVGTGWGALHCRYLRQASSKVRLFVCGRDPHRTARLARAVDAEAHFIGLEEAAEDPRVQALTLALPHDLHREAVNVAAAAQKHALVEKPIATTLEDADVMIRATQKANTILMVAEDMHFRPAVHEASRRIQRGDIGEPLYLLAQAGGLRRPKGWAAEKDRMGGGVLIDIGVHYIRGLRLLLGEPDRVIATRAMQINPRMSEEDSVQLLFSSNAGWQAHLLLSWSSQRGHLPDIVIAGEKGTLHLWPRTRYIDYYPIAPLPLTRIVSEVRPYWLQEKLMSPRLQRTRIKLRGTDLTGYLGEMEEFLAAVAEDREPITSAEDGRRDLEIVLRCYDALNTGLTTGIPALKLGSST